MSWVENVKAILDDLEDAMQKATGPAYNQDTDSLEAISNDIDHQHQNIHILFILPEAVGSITADNTALLTELQKLADVLTITQADALEFPAFGSYAMAVMGSNSGAAWTTSNLADLKNILGLTLLCVDKVSAAYFEIGTDGGDAAAKTVIKAISEIEGTKMGEGDTNHQAVTGIDAGNNTVSSSAIYHTLDMSDANITETVFCTEANDPDGGTANQDVVLGVIRRIQNDGSIGVDEAGDDVPATLGFAGFAYEGDKLTTLGKALFLLFCHELIQLRIQEGAVEAGGLILDISKRLFGNMKGSFTNADPLVEYIAGLNSIGSKLPVGTSLVDIINTIDGIVDTLLTRLTALRAGYLDELDFDLQGLLNAIAGYIDTEVGSILTIVNNLPNAGALNDLATLITELAKVPKSDSTVSWNATALTAIEAEAIDALESFDLDHLINVALAAALDTFIIDDSILGFILAKSDVSTYDRTTDSLEAISEAIAAVAGVNSYQEQIPDTDFSLAAIDTTLTADPPNADAENSVVDIDANAGDTFVLRSLIISITSFGTGTKLIFKLWVPVNGTITEVDSVDITATGIQNLMDIFGLQEVHGDSIHITVQVDSGTTGACEGTWKYAKAS